MNDEQHNLTSMRFLADEWADDIADHGFTQRVLADTRRWHRRRQMAVALAGMTGGAVASLQLSELARHELVVGAAQQIVGPMQAFAQPQLLAALGMAAIAVCVAWVLPNRV